MSQRFIRWCVLWDFMQMGYNSMYDILFLHFRYVLHLFQELRNVFKLKNLCLQKWFDTWMKSEILNKCWGLFSKVRPCWGLGRCLCFVFVDTHTFMLQTLDLVTFVFGLKTHQESSNLEIVFMVVFLVFMLFLLLFFIYFLIWVWIFV